MMGLVFRQPKVPQDVQDNRVASSLEADSTASYGFTANNRNKHWAACMDHAFPLSDYAAAAWLALHFQEKFPAYSRNRGALLANSRSPHPPTEGFATNYDSATGQADKGHQNYGLPQLMMIK